MAIFLTDLANWLREAGLKVIEYDGWQGRARGSGGYSALPLCVMWHHTASPSSWDGQKDADYCAVGDEDAPLANLYIDRSGTVWVLAAGATNTNGKGKSIAFSRGTVPTDGMNTRAIGVEMGNDGVGEPWPEVQVSAMIAVSNVCNAKCGNQPSDLATHHFYAPDRKIDPARADAVEGPWQPDSCTSSGTWDRDDIIEECLWRAGKPPPIPEPEPPQPEPEPGDDFMAALPTIKKGDSGPYVVRMQHLLAAGGYMNPGNTANYDGVWGNGTDGAKARFDGDHGLGSSDTSCGSKSWESLMTGKVW